MYVCTMLPTCRRLLPSIHATFQPSFLPSAPCPPPTLSASVCTASPSSPGRPPAPQVARWGPDRLLPANSLTTTWPDGRVEVRTHPHPSSDYPTMSVWTMLHQTAARVPNRTALAVKREGVWVKWTYAEYLEQVAISSR